MKLILLTASRIKNDFTNHLLTVLLYLAGSTVCIFVFIIFFKNITGLSSMLSQYDIQNRQFQIFMSSPITLKKESFDFLDKYDIENISCNIYIFEDNNKYEIKTYSDENYIYSLCSSEKEREQVGNFFGKHKSNQILTPLSYPSKITVKNIEFESYPAELDTAYIDFSEFCRYEMETSDITLTLKRSMSASENEQLKKLLVTEFSHMGSVNIYAPNENTQNMLELSELIFDMTSLILIFLISFVACAMLFRYVFSLNSYENVMYCIVGASKISVVFIALSEALLFVLTSNMLAITAHLLLHEQITLNTGLMDTSYSAGDYLTVVLVTTVLSMITIIPFFISYIRKPIISNKNKYS
ncbi:MAG: hypothetical protein IIT39_06015 [Clostridia bacterium]|nr:hypothetical protein [Clostridia bacterium]